jgi:hypothetical protein
MRLLPIAFLLLCLFSTVSSAQSNYKPGYIISLKGDTVKGYVDYRNWRKNPKTFSFKSAPLSAVQQVFDRTNAGSVTITGFENYRRFIVALSLDETDDLRLNQGINTKVKIDTVFLKMVNSGKFVSLYSYRDKLKKRYFIAENSQQPSELILRKYLDPNQASQTIVVDSYKRQLQSLAYKYQPQNEGLMQEIQEANYAEQELEEIVFKINGSEKALTFSSTETYKSRLFVGAGANFLSVNNLTGSDLFTNSPDKNYTANLPVGVELTVGEDIYLKRTSRSLIFRGEVHVSFNSNNQIHTKTNDSLLLTYKFTTLTFNPQLLYNIYNEKNAKIYVAAGGELVVYEAAKTNYTPAGQVHLGFIPIPVYTAFTFYPTIKAGAVINDRLNFYAGYDPNLKYGSTNKLSALHIGINYLFGENR